MASVVVTTQNESFFAHEPEEQAKPMKPFISYSRRDAADFASGLYDALHEGRPAFEPWWDKFIHVGDNWAQRIARAIRDAECLLFVITGDSVSDQSVCNGEWGKALQYKKPIVPLLVHREAECDIPLQLVGRQYIKFYSNFDSAMEQLRAHLLWLETPAGRLQEFKYRLEAAQRELQYAQEQDDAVRLQEEINTLKADIARQQSVLDDPEGAAARARHDVDTAIERERRPKEKEAPRKTHSRFINRRPAEPPEHFQDRTVETKLVYDFLRAPALRFISVIGRGGIGKTALICRLLKMLEDGVGAEEQEPLPVDGIVYLSARYDRISAQRIFADLASLLPDDVAAQLNETYRTAQVGMEAKVHALLEHFSTGCVVVLLDNFEDMMVPESRTVKDRELFTFLKGLLELPQHAVRVIITSRILPRDLAAVQPARHRQLDIEEGLPSPYAENILREMDKDGKVGLKTASPELLDEARQRTLGFPRALEALFAILAADRHTTLAELLQDSRHFLPEEVVEQLVGEAFNRLDRAAQQVMEALAVYDRPVPNVAVDCLLLPFVPTADSYPILSRLVNMHFVRKDGRRYSLHPVDRDYALGRIPLELLTEPQVARTIEGQDPVVKQVLGERANGHGELLFTQRHLRLLAADYYRRTRTPRESWKTLEDLEPHLAEFDLRCAAEDYDRAAEVLLEFDYRYLYLWGHYRLLADSHERLRGKVKTALFQERCVGHLGVAYAEMGEVFKAISVTEEALTIAESIGVTHDRVLWLGNLGTMYHDIGDTSNALAYYERAAEVNRQASDSQYLTAVNLIYQGECHGELGDLDKAIAQLSEAFSLASGAWEPARAGLAAGHLALVLVDAGRWEEAIEHAQRAIDIGRENGVAKTACLGAMAVGLVWLENGEWRKAQSAITEAYQYNQPLQSHICQLLLGIIALRLSNPEAAGAALKKAIEDADAVLRYNAQCFRALDSIGLACAAEALSSRSPTGIARSEEFHRKARQLNHDAGNVKRLLRLYDVLSPLDTVGILVAARSAAGGT